MKDKTVLCVDDELGILKSLKRLLRRENFKVLTANSAAEGLDLLTENSVQLVISDQRMPEMLGTEFLQQVKQLYPDTVRVILSGYAEMNSIYEAINMGEVYRFMTKPWDDEELRQNIRDCLAHYDDDARPSQTIESLEREAEDLAATNDVLCDTMSKRTVSLKCHQVVLEKLPVPVAAVSYDDVVVIANEAFRDLAHSVDLDDLRGLQGVLGAETVDSVRAFAIGTEPSADLSTTIGDESFRVSLTRLDDQQVDGYLLVLHEKCQEASHG